MIKDLKELTTLLQLCRKQGVTEIKIGDCHIKLGDAPRKESRDRTKQESHELTDEQLMFYSVDGAISENQEI